jgi:hypothetical protein
MRSAWLAVILDGGCVLVFVIIGRASHVRGESLAGIASTAWPFLAGLAGGGPGSPVTGTSRNAGALGAAAGPAPYRDDRRHDRWHVR